MKTSDLPADLVEEILSRVPATSLKRLRTTCKRWDALFKDRRFAEKHILKAPKQPRLLMLKEYRLCSMNIDLNVVPPSIQFKDELDLKDSHSNSEQVDLLDVFHCDGLLLFTTNDNKLMVCNPWLGETRWIQLDTGNRIHSKFALGYENRNTCRSYKILRRWVCYETNDRVSGFNIYDFTSDSWRVLNAPNAESFKPIFRGVSLKGNAYRLASDDIGHSIFLLKFDFTREIFRRLSLPPPLSLDRGCSKLSVVREEELSVLSKHINYSEVEIWVSKKIDTEAELSWSKSFAVDLHHTPGGCVFVYTSLLIDEEKKVALCCSVSGGNKIYVIGKDGEYYTETPVLEYKNRPFSFYCCPLIFNYVPSLVPIQ